ncbi:GNAT family N-acetyltransferase [Balneola vulgaris]|uniref:GNAT family N-acetyltransferase n=1 Tax=Balneola vulgaris TaxID=287535 RepID=UPI000369A5BB|nr:GNAT family N-acetyltransferase [Balneola vulgaris]
MEKKFLSFNDLSARELYDCLKLRQDVFIIEQDCIYPDIDNHDADAIHFFLYLRDELAAYARIFPPTKKYEDESSIGRIVVASKHRGTDVGKTLISESIQYCSEHYPQANIRIEAQAKLDEYYQKYGFVKEGGVYVVDGIDHQQMVWKKKY